MAQAVALVFGSVFTAAASVLTAAIKSGLMGNSHSIDEANARANEEKNLREAAEKRVSDLQAEMRRKLEEDASNATKENTRILEEARKEALEALRVAEERENEARRRAEKAERSLREKEMEKERKRKERLEYPVAEWLAPFVDNNHIRYINIALVGQRGVGKSSLINSFRGLKSKKDSSDQQIWAQTGVQETTINPAYYELFSNDCCKILL